MVQSIRLDQINHRQLDASNGRQDHTVLPYASVPFVLRAALAHEVQLTLRAPFAPDAAASIAPRANVRDDRDTPLVMGAGWGGVIVMICPTGSVEYFHPRGWTTQIRLIRLRKSTFPRIGFRAGYCIVDRWQMIDAAHRANRSQERNG
jgi:hypothetical protein